MNLGHQLIRKIVVGVLGLILLWAIFSWRDMMRWVYPVYYASTIDKNSRQYGVDPFLVTAVILIESNFDKNARSIKGACGLMQIMPDTANWIAGQVGYSSFEDTTQLFDPEVNVKLGTSYLASLYAQFGDWVVALAAYNGGRGNVQKWLDEKRWSGALDTISDIPFAETRSYVTRVMHAFSWYKRIYRDDWEVAMARSNKGSSLAMGMGKVISWLHRWLLSVTSSAFKG